MSHTRQSCAGAGDRGYPAASPSLPQPRAIAGAQKTLHLLGVSFRTAPVAVRESLSFTTDEARTLIRRITTSSPACEVMVLSTCNRTEFYLAAPERTPAVDTLLTSLREMRPQAHILHAQCLRYQEAEGGVVRHLLRVTCGLDSAILGDTQIFGQVKAALRLTEQSGALGPSLQKIVAMALRAAKRARRETAIGAGSASLGSAIADLLSEREVPLGIDGRATRVLIIGAGAIARDIGRHVTKGGHRSLAFVNRTRSRAETLALDCGGRAHDWSGLTEALAAADFVVTATASPSPVLTRAMLDALPTGSPTLFIDAGVPRNIEAGSTRDVLNIDSLRARQEAAFNARQAAVPAVERIVDEELTAWENWSHSQPVEGLLKKLYGEAHAISHLAAQSLAEGPIADAATLERFLHHTLQRLLTGHARGLRRWARARA